MICTYIPRNFMVEASVPFCDRHIRPRIIFCIVSKCKDATLFSAAVPKCTFSVSIAPIWHATHCPARAVHGRSAWGIPWKLHSVGIIDISTGRGSTVPQTGATGPQPTSSKKELLIISILKPKPRKYQSLDSLVTFDIFLFRSVL